MIQFPLTLATQSTSAAVTNACMYSHHLSSSSDADVPTRGLICLPVLLVSPNCTKGKAKWRPHVSRKHYPSQYLTSLYPTPKFLSVTLPRKAMLSLLSQLKHPCLHFQSYLLEHLSVHPLLKMKFLCRQSFQFQMNVLRLLSSRFCSFWSTLYNWVTEWFLTRIREYLMQKQCSTSPSNGITEYLVKGGALLRT